MCWQPFVVVSCVLLLASPAHAGLHTLSVLTQAQGENRTQAKEDALASARAQAVAQIARKLDPAKAEAYLMKLKRSEADTMIRGLTIEKEENLGGTYFARVRVTVMDGPILRAYGEGEPEVVASDVRVGRSLLVLPVFFDGREAVVWDPKTNPTFAMWQEKGLAIGKGALILPTGDTADRSIVDRDNVLTAKYDELKAMFVDYGVDELAVVVVTDALLTEHKDEVQVLLRRVRKGGQTLASFVVTPEAKPPSREAIYAMAVEQAAEKLVGIAASTSKREVQARADASEIALTVGFTTLRDWGAMQEKLRMAEGFVGMKTHSLKLREASVTVYVKGAAEAYVEALRVQGLVVTQVGGGWRVSSR